MPVLVLEDSLPRWRALKRCLATQTDLMFVRCAVPAAEILTHCSRLSPCILVIDHPSLDQIDPQRLMQTVDFGRSVRVLVKVSREDPKTVERLLRAGCMGVVAEGSAPSVLGHAIRALAKDEIWASPRFLADFVRGLLSSDSRHNLTPREAQILELITQGRSNRGIAEELFISRETVRWHIRTLYAKIGVHDRTEAANYGTRIES
jgi:DNA-binding NarL/FixJ family response regulator